MTMHYIGTKQVLAWPADKDGKAGYQVKYQDGYISWSPKDVFEAAYIPQGHDPSRVTQEMVDEFIVASEFTRMGNHTVVLATCRNGFTFIAESACVDPANYNEQVGFDLAMKKIKSQVWAHLGFLLASAKNGNNDKPKNQSPRRG